MLQQTQVSRVEAYYQQFLDRYPSVESLAAASPSAVRESWDGLGYYNRAANLHRLARRVVTEHAGVLPSDPTLLLELPGVGRYTAAAVASFAYEQSVPAVDTNVARVLRRVFHPRLRSSSGESEAVGDRCSAGAAGRQASLGIQPGDHGARRTRLHRSRRAMRRVPGPNGM